MVLKQFFDISTSFRFSDFQRSVWSVQSIPEACPCLIISVLHHLVTLEHTFKSHCTLAGQVELLGFEITVLLYSDFLAIFLSLMNKYVPH